MEITLTELMRIKKELNNTIAQFKNQISFKRRLGVTTEDGVCVDTSPEVNTIEQLSKLKAQMGMLCNISAIIDNINYKNNINDLIRYKSNLEYERNFLNTYMELFSHRTTQKRVTGDTAGTIRIATVEYTPFITKKEAKERVKNLKTQLREIQSKIDKVNSTVVHVDFTHEGIDELLLDN